MNNVQSAPGTELLQAGQERKPFSKTEAGRAFYLFTRNQGAVLGGIVMVIIVLLAVFANFVCPYDPIAQVPDDSKLPPSAAHWMGTDLMGRDILTRVIYGARVSMIIALVSVALSALAGTVIGLATGFYGGGLDAVLMRVMDAMMAFPGLLLALTVIVALGPGLDSMMIALGVGGIPGYARLVRGSTLSARANVFVEAARVIGCSDARIMMRHILPNVIAPIIVVSTLSFSGVILSAAGLSFLGVGAQPPTPEWGLMVSMGRSYLGTQWWMTTFPGLAITVVVIAVNLMGDGVREALDPRLRGV